MKLQFKSLLLSLALMTSWLGISQPLWAAGLSCRSVFTEARLERRLDAKMTAQVQGYLADTIQSLEHMRGDNGLVKDTILVQAEKNAKPTIQNLNDSTSPTNIAIDLLIQTELISQNSNGNHDTALAKKNISRILATLQKLHRHKSSGLFFSWYGTDQKSAVTGPNVSSIDNMHLALSLWTIRETFPGTVIAKKAQALLEPMDFSMFYDEASGLIGGNFSYINNGKRGKWVRDAYHFANLGSEARILYSAGWALGFFKKYTDQSDFVQKAFQSLQSEVTPSAQGPLLKLWDGSAFQLFFPKMFVSEEAVSPTLQQMYQASGDFMIAEGSRRKLSVPAAHSPGVNRVVEEAGQLVSIYNDKAGNKGLVSSGNHDVLNETLEKTWDGTFTPYALFMAATANPAKFLPLFEKMQKIKSGDDSLYLPGMGWMDGLHVSGELSGQVVPAQLAVNQGMIGMSLLQMQSPDGLSASGRAIHNNPQVSERIKIFYELFDQKLK
jgi:hypothetical protein